jgi:uncharacterized protein
MMEKLKPQVIVFMGMVATGKSSLARALAEKLGCSHINSDVIRKEMTGTTKKKTIGIPVNEGIYSPEISEKTYSEMRLRAKKQLFEQGAAYVVLDGSYIRRTERELLCTSFGNKVKVTFIHCNITEKEMKKRLELRAQDETEISDGRWEVYLEQKKRFEFPVELSNEQRIRLNTDQPISVLLNTCLLHLKLGNLHNAGR